MAESVDALVSNTSGAIHPGSIPGLGTRSCKFLLAALSFANTIAQMAESVDALVSNTSGATHPGSIPGLGTKSCKFFNLQFFFCLYTSTKSVSASGGYRNSYRNLMLLQSFIPSAGTTVGDWLLWLMTTDWRRTSLFTYSLNSPKVTSPLVSCNFFRR
jgi:hypothetical protein